MQQQLKTVGLGIAAGILSGLLGIGGAIIMVPGMVHFLNLPHHTATATSLAVIIPGAIVSALVYNSFGQLDLTLSAMFAVGGILGVSVGATLMPKTNPKVLKRIWAIIALLIAIKMGVE